MVGFKAEEVITFKFPLWVVVYDALFDQARPVENLEAFVVANVGGELTLLLFTSRDLATAHASRLPGTEPAGVPSPLAMTGLLARLYPSRLTAVAIDVPGDLQWTNTKKAIPEFLKILATAT